MSRFSWFKLNPVTWAGLGFIALLTAFVVWVIRPTDEELIQQHGMEAFFSREDEHYYFAHDWIEERHDKMPKWLQSFVDRKLQKRKFSLWTYGDGSRKPDAEIIKLLISNVELRTVNVSEEGLIREIAPALARYQRGVESISISCEIGNVDGEILNFLSWQTGIKEFRFGGEMHIDKIVKSIASCKSIEILELNSWCDSCDGLNLQDYNFKELNILNPSKKGFSAKFIHGLKSQKNIESLSLSGWMTKDGLAELRAWSPPACLTKVELYLNVIPEELLRRLVACKNLQEIILNGAMESSDAFPGFLRLPELQRMEIIEDGLVALPLCHDSYDQPKNSKLKLFKSNSPAMLDYAGKFLSREDLVFENLRAWERPRVFCVSGKIVDCKYRFTLNIPKKFDFILEGALSYCEIVGDISVINKASQVGFSVYDLNSRFPLEMKVDGRVLSLKNCRLGRGAKISAVNVFMEDCEIVGGADLSQVKKLGLLRTRLNPEVKMAVEGLMLEGGEMEAACDWSKLEILCVHGSRLPEKILENLPELKTLDLYKCPGKIQIPKLEKLSSLGLGGVELHSGVLPSLPALTSLNLAEMTLSVLTQPKLEMLRAEKSDVRLAHLPALKDLHVEATRLHGEPLSPGLKTLNLRRSTVAECVFGRSLPHLTELEMHRQKLSQGLQAALRSSPLQKLILNQSSLSLSELSLADLRDLRLEKADVDVEALMALRCPQLTELWLSGLPVNNEVAAFLRASPKLQKLDLSGSRLNSQFRLPELPDLEFLDLAKTGVLSASLLTAKLPKLTHLNLRACPVDNALAAWLESCPELRTLDLRQTLIKDDFGAVLPKLAQLEYVYLADTAVTDRALRGMWGDCLTLDLARTQVKGEFLASLRKKLSEDGTDDGSKIALEMSLDGCPVNPAALINPKLDFVLLSLRHLVFEAELKVGDLYLSGGQLPPAQGVGGRLHIEDCRYSLEERGKLWMRKGPGDEFDFSGLDIATAEELGLQPGEKYELSALLLGSAACRHESDLKSLFKRLQCRDFGFRRADLGSILAHLGSFKFSELRLLECRASEDEWLALRLPQEVYQLDLRGSQVPKTLLQHLASQLGKGDSLTVSVFGTGLTAADFAPWPQLCPDFEEEEELW
ncbi:MAG: hypothetical protein RL095_3404 [Verrucomicrobiota bacterium]|jgi:Leucine-rich repeat (LRR) protein